MTLVQVLEKPLNPEACEYEGYITKELLLAKLPENYKELFYFMCGPLPMMDAMHKHLAAMGVPEVADRIRKIRNGLAEAFV